MELAQPAAVLDATGAITVFGGSVPVAPEVAVVVATSGTGGAPRLAELSRDAVVSAIEGSAAALSPDATDLAAGPGWIACLTPAHVGGLLVLLRGEQLGTPVEVVERFDPLRVAVTAGFVSVVPSMLSRLVATGMGLSGLTLLVGGGALTPGVRSRAEDAGARVVSTYGMTETCGGVVYDGVPFAGTRIRIAGTDGAIEVRGPTLFAGYRADPDATGAAFDVQGWFRTRDLGTVTTTADSWCSGAPTTRSAREARRSGRRRSSACSRPTRRSPTSRSRAGPIRTWGQQVVAFVVPASDPPPTVEALRDHVRAELAAFKAPRVAEFVAEIPRTLSGKVRRSALGR